MERRLLFLAASLACLLHGRLFAHDFWIEPSTFRPAKGEKVTATLRVGEKLEGETFPRVTDLVDVFALKGRGASAPLDGDWGDDPAGAVRVVDGGLHWIVYQSHPFPLALEAKKFEESLRNEGLEAIVDARAKRGESAAEGRERFTRCAKALLSAGDERDSRTVFDAPLGLTLELVPGRNPYALRPGAELPLSLLFRGKPLAGALVVAMSKDDPEHQVSARTDVTGHAALRLPRAGFWLIKAVAMERAPRGAGVDWESWWASVTFELPGKK